MLKRRGSPDPILRDALRIPESRTGRSPYAERATTMNAAFAQPGMNERHARIAAPQGAEYWIDPIIAVADVPGDTPSMQTCHGFIGHYSP